MKFRCYFKNALLCTLALGFANQVVAEPYTLSATCSLPAFVPDKCMLTTRLTDVGTTKTTVKNVFIQVAPYVVGNNKKPIEPANSAYINVSRTYLDASDTTNLVSLANVYNVAATCGKTYWVRAVNTQKPSTKEGFRRIVMTCPAKRDL